MARRAAASVLSAFGAAAFFAVLLANQPAGVSPVKAAHAINGSPAAQSVWPGQTGIAVTIVGTVPGTVASARA